MSCSTLLILAGCSAAGKTTLLRTALESGLAIFGPEADPLFRTLSVPSLMPEDRLSFEQTLAERTWFQAIHLRALDALPALPDVVVLHVDLLNVLAQLSRDPAYFGPMSGVPSGLMTHTFACLAERERVAALYRHFLSLPVFRRFERVVVHTLSLSWDENRRRWMARARQDHRSRGVPWFGMKGVLKASRRLAGKVCRRGVTPAFVEQLFDPAARREDIHANLHAAWLEAVGALSPDHAITSCWKDGQLLLRGAGEGGRIPPSEAPHAAEAHVRGGA